jgi:hypothetical protein
MSWLHVQSALRLVQRCVCDAGGACTAYAPAPTNLPLLAAAVVVVVVVVVEVHWGALCHALGCSWSYFQAMLLFDRSRGLLCCPLV